MIKSGNIICSRQDKKYVPGHQKMFHESKTFWVLRSIQSELRKSVGTKACLVINRFPRSLFSKFNYFDIVASLHKYECCKINKNLHFDHL